MAVYSALSTVNTGDLWSASDHNTFIKANFDFIAETRWIPISLAALGVAESITAFPLDTIESTGASPQPRWYANRGDDATDEGREARNIICPPDYVGTPKLRIHYHMDGANVSKSVTVVTRIAAISDGDSSVEAKAYGTKNINVIAVPDAADEHDVAVITLTNADSLTAGDLFNLLLYRDGDATEAGATDDAVGDMIIKGLEFGYAFT